jgi:hypothetical protein
MATKTLPKPDRTVVKAVRIESELYRHAQTRINKEDLDFSKYVRRLMRADLAAAKQASAS